MGDIAEFPAPGGSGRGSGSGSGGGSGAGSGKGKGNGKGKVKWWWWRVGQKRRTGKEGQTENKFLSGDDSTFNM